MKKTAWFLVAGAIVVALGVAVFSSGNGADAAQIALGSNVYGEYCATCHGAGLEGQPNWRSPLPNGRLPAPPHDASGHTWHHSDGELTTIIRSGLAGLVSGAESDMPAYEGILADEEIAAVLAFIKSYWPPDERAYQAAQTGARP